VILQDDDEKSVDSNISLSNASKYVYFHDDKALSNLSSDSSFGSLSRKLNYLENIGETLKPFIIKRNEIEL
jgi:hypothetical protein